MEYVEIEVAVREKTGTSAVRRMRRDGVVPSVLYGMGRPNIHLAIARSEFERFLRSGSHLVQLRMGDKKRSAILREMQVDALSDDLLHADFTRVSDDIEIEDSCHLIFKGRAKGTSEGGVFMTFSESIQVRALPRDLPGEITIDISDMALGDSVRAGDVPLAEGVSLITDEQETLCQVSSPKAEAEPEVAEGEEEAAEEGAETPDAEAPSES